MKAYTNLHEEGSSQDLPSSWRDLFCFSWLTLYRASAAIVYYSCDEQSSSCFQQCDWTSTILFACQLSRLLSGNNYILTKFLKDPLSHSWKFLSEFCQNHSFILTMIVDQYYFRLYLYFKYEIQIAWLRYERATPHYCTFASL